MAVPSEIIFSISLLPRVGDTHMRPEHAGERRITLSEFCLLLRKSEPYSEELLKDILPLAHLCSLKDIVPYNSVSGVESESSLKGCWSFSCVASEIAELV